MGGVAVSSSPNGVSVGETKLLSKANVRPIFFCALAVVGAILYVMTAPTSPVSSR